MKIILFENFDELSLDVHYEIKRINKNGDVEDFLHEDNYNPFDLVEVLEYMLEYEDEFSGLHNLFINKVTSERVSDEELEKAKMKIDAKKYNI